MKENTYKPSTVGIGSLSGDLLVLFSLIVAGVFGTVWFLTLEKTEFTRILHGGVGIILLILMQPGVFLSMSFFKKATYAAEHGQPWKKLTIIGLSVAIAIGLILPIALATWINGLI